MRKEYVERGLDREPDRFVLYRIIGNDLHPRHRKGQSRENVRFILENEPDLAGCEKRWVINRIFDTAEEAAILAMLEEAEQPYLRIPFDLGAYRKIPWDFECFPEPGFFLRGSYSRMHPHDRDRADMHALRLKNNYAMNNNGARNAALRDGRSRAKWVLPWDGNCFLTSAGWEAVAKAVTSKPYLKYFVVPMARVTDNQLLLDPSFRPEAQDEPQIVFRRDAEEEFSGDFPYGRRPKVELLWRLGIAGPWDDWRDDLWDLGRPVRSNQAGQFANAGWVARLFSGQAALEEPTAAAGHRPRGRARIAAIRTTLAALDDDALRLTFDQKRLFAYDEAKLERLREVASGSAGDSPSRLALSLRQAADAALRRGPYSVVDKSEQAPSGDPHDYFHPSPYWWPNPDTPDGLPYVPRDGLRAPGTRLYEPESDRYDRTRLQRLFDDTTVLALAWFVTGQYRYAEHGARLVRHWFIAAESRMNPHLRYAQVRLGRDNNEGFSTGIIEFKDLYFFLDGVRLLGRAGALGEADRGAFAEWLRAYLDWLWSSRQGIQERQSENNHGTCYDLQSAAIAAYLGDRAILQEIFRTSHERLLEQFNANGRQPHEMTRTLTAHYCCFNLQSWVNLATLAERCGIDLWSVAASDGRGLRLAFEWLLPYKHLGEWPFPQVEPFDFERFSPLSLIYRDRYGSQAEREGEETVVCWNVKPLFNPHDGIKPFWMLG